MARQLNVTVADSVYNRIEQLMYKKKAKNRSEITEELLRTGLDFEEQKEDDDS